MAAPDDRTTYPQLSAAATATMAQRLVDIVSLQHGEALADDQLLELRTRVGSQLAAAARLHQFPLSNDQEPIFLVRTDEGGSA